MSNGKTQLSVAAKQLASVAFQEYAPRLHAYLLRRTRSDTDVPDLTMEVYERFLRVRHIDAIENPRAYLFRIASHVAGEAQRLKARDPVAYDSPAVEGAANSIDYAAADQAAERLDSTRELQEVYQAIGQLPPMHQAVLLLAARDGLTHKEVSRRTGLTTATVKLYVCEARARLRTLLSR